MGDGYFLGLVWVEPAVNGVIQGSYFGIRIEYPACANSRPNSSQSLTTPTLSRQSQLESALSVVSGAISRPVEVEECSCLRKMGIAPVPARPQPPKNQWFRPAMPCRVELRKQPALQPATVRALTCGGIGRASSPPRLRPLPPPSGSPTAGTHPSHGAPPRTPRRSWPTLLRPRP